MALTRFMPWPAAASVWMLSLLLSWCFPTEISWDRSDFAVFAALLFGACMVYEAAVRGQANNIYRWAVATSITTSLFLIWINLAVGLIGSEEHPANLMYAGVLVALATGALWGSGDPVVMWRTLILAACLQLAIGAIALMGRLGSESPSFPEAVVFLTLFFTVLWIVSASLFMRSARS